MAAAYEMSLEFPVGGLHRQASYQKQPPFTTPDALNVRPVDVLEGRGRGGSRPGLEKAFPTQLASGVPIRMMQDVTVVRNDGFSYWDDLFDRATLGGLWSTASWIGQSPLLIEDVADDPSQVPEVGAVRDALTIDSDEVYSVNIYIVPWEGDFQGEYVLYARMDDSTPDATDEGIEVRLILNSGDGSYSGSLKSYSSGTPTNYAFTPGAGSGTDEAGWLSVLISGDNVKVFWKEALIKDQNVSAHTGTRVGFGAKCTEINGVCLIDQFRLQYYLSDPPETERRFLVASAGGNLYREDLVGALTQISTSLSLASDRNISAVPRLQKLYIADHSEALTEGSDGVIAANGVDLTSASVADWTALSIDAEDHIVVLTNSIGATDDGVYQIDSIQSGKIVLSSTAGGSGSCSFRVERGPKIYDPADDSLSLWMAESGNILTGCPIVVRWNDRLWLGGAATAPHLWAASRQGDPLDWDYSATDSQRAVAGTSTDAGLVADPLTAIVPASEDYLIFFSENSTWILRGDPAFGGRLDALSHEVGAISRNAWCRTPGNEILFLSHDGIYIIPPGAGVYPVSFSRERLPRELLEVNASQYELLMEYDIKDRGIHLYLSPLEEGIERYHWWIDWQSKSFWPVELQDSHVPTALFRHISTIATEDAVMLGCTDGYIRRYANDSESDDGSAISSYVVYGPMRTSRGHMREGIVREIIGVLGEGSGDVDWSLLAGETMEQALSASASATGTWSDGAHGRNLTARPRVRAAAWALKLSNGGAAKWIMEAATAAVRPSGRQRL